ncbi:MAG: hypothetical protein ACOH2M_03900 [Cypionkella sp.]|jgi:hypothetical protein
MFKPAEGLPYTKFLERFHSEVLLDWYLEIGCQKGRSFAPSRSKTIAVDPYFRVKRDVINAKTSLHIFQTTSDAFYAEKFLDKMKIKLSFSFLDGMHLFEFLLRDVINTEAHSAKDGVIALHDCCPFSLEMTTRDVKNLPRGAWTGDVWKLLPILQEYRPDLKITVLDAAPTGLVLISNLAPKNTVLLENYDAILAKYLHLELEDHGVARFFNSFAYTSTEAFIAEGFPLFAKLRLDPGLAYTPVMVST